MPPEGIYRKKLLNAILYFAENTEYLGKVKLAKLLHYLDFNHFKETGYPSIGLRYKTYPFGPLPEGLWTEVADGETPSDFTGYLKLIKWKNNSVFFKAIKSPDMSVFSLRETEIMKELADKYKNYGANGMVKVSHEDDQPWSKVVNRYGKERKMIIPYDIVIDDDSTIDIQEARIKLREFFSMLDNFDLHPTVL
jgi:uncharacterized phage-associated protein